MQFENTTVVHDLTFPIRSKIFNLELVLELDFDQFLADTTILPCNCDNSTFVDKNHGHMLMGDLKIIQNNEMRKNI